VRTETVSLLPPPAPRPCEGGIASYLHTMFTVAHAPGMYHWCTPGHNRGKASEALTARHGAGLSACHPVRYAMALEAVHD
jgi:hypothetical protein